MSWGSPTPRTPPCNHAADTTDVFQARRTTLGAHGSQVGPIPDQDGPTRRGLVSKARRHGLAEGQRAEEGQIVQVVNTR